MGGCQFEVKAGDEVLWAFDAFNKEAFLKVEPSALKVKRGGSRSVSVTDGKTGKAVQGAVIGGVTTDGNGKAMLRFENQGTFRYKATREGAVRSNVLVVVVVGGGG